MELSIIIPCRDDLRIRQCLESIDDPEAEVVISLNGATDEIRRIVAEYSARRGGGVQVVESGVANLAAALQVGSLAASGKVLLYMDSDCRFEPGAVARFREAAQCHPVVKGNIRFEWRSWVTRIIARSREHHTADVVTAYKPPLAIHADIREHIGGYFFDERLRWREDSDLDHRIRQAGFPIYFESEALIHHPPLSAQEDLRSTFRYGIGLARARWYGIPLTEVPRSVFSTLRCKGLLPALYMLFRNRIYDFGTALEGYRLSRGGTG